jgi:hypothetical protein
MHPSINLDNIKTFSALSRTGSAEFLFISQYEKSGAACSEKNGQYTTDTAYFT